MKTILQVKTQKQKTKKLKTPNRLPEWNSRNKKEGKQKKRKEKVAKKEKVSYISKCAIEPQRLSLTHHEPRQLNS